MTWIVRWSCAFLFAALYALPVWSDDTGIQGEPAYECEAEAHYFNSIAPAFDFEAPVPESDACFQSWDTLDHDSSIIVDVRPKSDFQKARLPSSINLKPIELLHTDSLKRQSVIVVDQGFRVSAQRRLCAAALNAGFSSFRILRSGLSGLHAAGVELAGLPHNLERLHEISLRDFVAELYASSLAVFVQADHREYYRKAFPPQVFIAPFSVEADAEASILSVLQSQAIAQSDSMVFVSSSDHFQRAAASWQGVFTLPFDVFEIAGYMNSQELLREKRKQIPERYRCSG
ncbi:rhodanese-like domain-containing protein [Marinobacter xestospongiae]|uniref:Rhodanese-like domain-containing protein n=1 Tax=Marinobacter xestospongiae TaxID=994319 RepID=A0ABU3VW64_9GAMM|nr:rhodanese-like domain-containing protein [Marinobacter xestospongiae]MDV2078514.1 rhodanese-like domain-containing protein [Marinobacter xestospongiae]